MSRWAIVLLLLIGVAAVYLVEAERSGGLDQVSSGPFVLFLGVFGLALLLMLVAGHPRSRSPRPRSVARPGRAR